MACACTTCVDFLPGKVFVISVNLTEPVCNARWPFYFQGGEHDGEGPQRNPTARMVKWWPIDRQSGWPGDTLINRSLLFCVTFILYYVHV